MISRRRIWRLGLRWFYLACAILIAIILLCDILFDINYQFGANLALLVLAALVNAFTLLYVIRSKWRSNRIGRIFLAKCAVLSLVLDQIVLAVWWDLEFPGRQHVRFAIYALGALVYIPMLISLWCEQQRDRGKR